MIIVIVTACSILHGSICQEFRLPQMAENVTPYQCMHYGQFAMVEWKRSHPNWAVHRWQCVRSDRMKAKA